MVLNTASGERMRTSGTFNIRLKLQDTTVVSPFTVCPDLPHAGIIGINIMRQHGIILDPVSGKLFTLTPQLRKNLDLDQSAFKSSIAEIETAENEATDAHDELNDDPWTIRTTSLTKIEPMTARLVRCKLLDAAGQPLANQEAICSVASLEVAVQSDRHGNFQIYVPNASTDDFTPTRGTTLATARPLREAAPLTARQGIEKLSAVFQGVEATEKPQYLEPKALAGALASSASPTAKREYVRLLLEFSDIVSTDQHDLGRSDAMSHEIELADNTPVYTQQYRLPLEQIQLVKDHLHAWLKAGIVEKARSKYNSPVFCVPKKDSGKLRVVLDYRKLNAKCMPDKYSIRPVEQCLEEIGHANSKVFSCIDLRSGFWQLPLDKSSRPLTAFTIPGVGQFQYTVAPMGLAGSPASFSRLMDHIMRELSFVITYIDDCLVHSPDEHSHAQHVRAAFQRLREHKLKINIEKCIFGAKSIQYLGHTISGDGIRPGHDKAAAVADAGPPATVKQVRSFMGLANYFRQFIPNFATIAAPMFALTRDNSEWKRGPLPPAAVTAFKKLKHAITSEPVLMYHTRNGKYHLYTDAALGDAANIGGLGAVLMQEDTEGIKHPVGYASRRLQTHEKNYPAFLLEMQAAVFAMEHFDTHLRGRHFCLYTDHKPLCKLSTVHTKTLNRLQMKMLEMYPQILHIPGGENSVADFLSRYQGIAAAQVDASNYRIRALQEDDPTLPAIIEKCKEHDSFKDGDNSEWIKVGRAKFCMRDNILCMEYGNPKTGALAERNLRICAPDSLQKELLVEAHNNKLAGHQGAYKSLERIKGKFAWPNMEEHVREHVARCKSCLATTNKGTTDLPRQQQLQLPPGPNWRVHADLFGPNKCQDGKKRYVLVITDAFTKAVALRVLDDKCANTVATGILEAWCYTYGIPKKIITDQGLEFTNELARNLWTSLQIKHTTTTPYHPQCNSSAEVFNRTMRRYLAAAIKEAGASTLDWPLYVMPLMFAYNTSIHKAAKESPFMTTFGYDPRVPLWDSQTEDAEADISRAEYADRFFAHKKAQSATRKIVLNNLQHDRDLRTTAEQRHGHADGHEYQAGDLVWVKIMQTTDPNKKFAQTWETGTILERTGFGTYKVRRDERSRKKTATLNASQLKPRHTEDSESTDSEPDDEEDEPAEDVTHRQNAEQTADAAAVHLQNGQVVINGLTPADVCWLLSQGYTLSSHGNAAQHARAAAAASGTASTARATRPAQPPQHPQRRHVPKKKSVIGKTKARGKRMMTILKNKARGKTEKSSTPTENLQPDGTGAGSAELNKEPRPWPSTTGPPPAAAFSSPCYKTPPTSPPSTDTGKLTHSKAKQKLASFLSSGPRDRATADESSWSLYSLPGIRPSRPRPPPGTYKE